MRSELRFMGLTAAAILTVAACQGRDETATMDTAMGQVPEPLPVAVTVVELGNAIDANMRVVAPATTFSRRDTIYASVATDGAGDNVSLAAKWLDANGNLVDSTATVMTLAGPATHEFHIVKATPWPTGTYSVVILLNGAPVSTKEFEIK